MYELMLLLWLMMVVDDDVGTLKGECLPFVQSINQSLINFCSYASDFPGVAIYSAYGGVKIVRCYLFSRESCSFD